MTAVCDNETLLKMETYYFSANWLTEAFVFSDVV